MNNELQQVMHKYKYEDNEKWILNGYIREKYNLDNKSNKYWEPVSYNEFFYLKTN